jgi:hypothetical protein
LARSKTVTIITIETIILLIKIVNSANVGARAFSWLADAGGPEATDESPGEEGRRFRALAGGGVGRNFIPATEQLFSPRKTAGKAPT